MIALATFRIAGSERVFVAGLLHDIGKLVIYHQLPEQAERILPRSIRAHHSSMWSGICSQRLWSRMAEAFSLPEKSLQTFADSAHETMAT